MTSAPLSSVNFLSPEVLLSTADARLSAAAFASTAHPWPILVDDRAPVNACRGLETGPPAVGPARLRVVAIAAATSHLWSSSCRCLKQKFLAQLLQDTFTNSDPRHPGAEHLNLFGRVFLTPSKHPLVIWRWSVTSRDTPGCDLSTLLHAEHSSTRLSLKLALVQS